jgi:hypothetical protein
MTEEPDKGAVEDDRNAAGGGQKVTVTVFEQVVVPASQTR